MAWFLRQSFSPIIHVCVSSAVTEASDDGNADAAATALTHRNVVLDPVLRNDRGLVEVSTSSSMR